MATATIDSEFICDDDDDACWSSVALLSAAPTLLADVPSWLMSSTTSFDEAVDDDNDDGSACDWNSRSRSASSIARSRADNVRTSLANVDVAPSTCRRLSNQPDSRCRFQSIDRSIGERTKERERERE